MRVALVIGTRPQIIKSAPIIHNANKFPDIELFVVHTGQHYDYEMSKQFFNELSLPDPVVNLGVGSGSHNWQTAQMMMGLDKAYAELKPDIVLVPGDTNSTLAGALTAAKMRIPVAHVEAGARSFDMRMPEEVNRRLTDHCSARLFAVTEGCAANLRREGIREDRIVLSGDTMYESVQRHRRDIDKEDVVGEFGLAAKNYGVLTLHRAENTDEEERFRRIIGSLLELDLDIVFPCHPRTKNRLNEIGLLGKVQQRFRLIQPVSYFRMLSLVKNAAVVLTDSGGLQKEAFWLRTPCVTLRDSTEWLETVEAGTNHLVGSDPEKIARAVGEASAQGFPVTPFEDSELLIPDASVRILSNLLSNGW